MIKVDDAKEVPRHGIIENAPQFFFDSKESLNYKTDLLNLMTWREVAENYSAADESPTTLFKINLKYNFEIGSEDSLNLHISLSKVQDVATHNSDSVQMLMTYKWRKLGWISQYLCFVYFAYLIALFYHADNYT